MQQASHSFRKPRRAHRELALRPTTLADAEVASTENADISSRFSPRVILNRVTGRVSLMITESLTSLFPNGILHYLAGGILIGVGVAVLYLGTGILAGASTFLESTLSYVSTSPRFQRTAYVRSRDWRVMFTVGIVAGAAIWTVALGAGGWTTDVAAWRLFVGGTLVGIGTRLGKGCTSGHGVCGVGSVSRTSLANVATFVLVAIGTAQVVLALGVRP